MTSVAQASQERLAYWAASAGMPGFFRSILDYQVAKAFSHIGHGDAESGEIFEPPSGSWTATSRAGHGPGRRRPRGSRKWHTTA